MTVSGLARGFINSAVLLAGSKILRYVMLFWLLVIKMAGGLRENANNEGFYLQMHNASSGDLLWGESKSLKIFWPVYPNLFELFPWFSYKVVPHHQQFLKVFHSLFLLLLHRCLSEKICQGYNILTDQQNSRTCLNLHPKSMTMGYQSWYLVDSSGLN